MTSSDLELLWRFTRDHEQNAFTELVERHLNLVYSAALRQVRSPQLAEEIAQSVFADLARDAGKLKADTVLVAWLHAVTRRTAVDVIRKESRRQLREQLAIEMNALNAPDAHWNEVEPLLDEAVAALDETDRAAVLLRYFENKPLRDIGQQLGISDDAAQKRVGRAVERLREIFAKRGVTVGAGGLVVVISANAVQAAPVGLALTISTAAALTGITFASTATITTAKAIAMTALQKTTVAATIAVLTGMGIYEARNAAQLREQVRTLQQQQMPLVEQNRQLQSERDNATNHLADLLAENSRLKSNSNEAELLKLRGEVGRLRMETESSRQQISKLSALNNSRRDKDIQQANGIRLKQLLEQMPDQKIPELSFLDDNSYNDAAGDSDLSSNEGVKDALGRLRFRAENLFVIQLQSALQRYTQSNAKSTIPSLPDLAKYFDPPIDANLLERYQVVNTGTNIIAGWNGGWAITQKNAVDPERDQRWSVSPVGFGPADFRWAEQKFVFRPRELLTPSQRSNP